MLKNFYGFAVFAIVFFSLKVFALPVLDQDFPCLSAEQANRYIHDFNIDVPSFGGLDLCDAKRDTKKLLNDLYIVENGQFETEKENLLIKGFIPTDRYYDWLRQQTRGIERGNDIPYATAYNSGGYFTMQDGWATLSTLGRVGTLIHEARHTEGFYHIICQTGPYRDTSVPGCDINYNYGGSHAIEMEYYARVAVYGKNFHPQYQTMARLMALARSNFVFNTTPIQASQTLVAISWDGHLFMRSQDQWLARTLPPLSGQLKTTSYGAALFREGHAFALDLYENSKEPVATSDDYSYFKLLKSNRVQHHVVDFEEIDFGTKRFVFSLSDDGKLYSYTFASGSWSRAFDLQIPAQRLETASPSGQKGLFVVSAAGDVLEINPAQPMQQRLLTEKWPVDLSKVVFWEESPRHLWNNGALDGFSDVRFSQIVNAPLYNAFEVHPE